MFSLPERKSGSSDKNNKGTKRKSPSHPQVGSSKTLLDLTTSVSSPSAPLPLPLPVQVPVSPPSDLFTLPQRSSILSYHTPPAEQQQQQQPSTRVVHSSKQTTLDQFVDRPEKKIASLPLVTKLDCLYWIRKPAPDEKWKIMANPVTKGFAGEESESYPLYVEGNEWIGVPRYFGMDTYGHPTNDLRSMGAEMNPTIKFTWKLQNTPQKPQVDAVKAWTDNRGEGVLCLPCGGGKTVIAVYLSLLMHRRTLILVQNGGLLLQWVERIGMICPQAKIGIIQQGKCQIEGMDFVIGMIQTVRGSTTDLSSFGMVIVDECHHIAAKTFSQSVMKTRPRYMLGLSATPERRDGLTHVLHWLLGPLLFKSDRKDITPQHITQIEYPFGNQKVICYKGGVKGIPSMVTRMAKDTKRNQLLDVCITRLIQTPGISKILVISDRREHLEDMNVAYEKKYSTGLYIGGMKKTDLEESKTKQIIFASYSMAKEYLDIDGLNGMVLATPCIVDTEQVVGRLRENLSSQYGCKTMDEDDDYEEEIDCVLESLNLPNDLCTLVKNYTRRHASRKRIVYDVIDPFDLFDALAWKRFHVYKRLGYNVKRVKFEEWIK